MLSGSLELISSRTTIGNVVNCFERQAATTPTRIAIEFEGSRWTYADLDHRANQIAKFLIERGLEREARIGICLDRSASAIAAMIGIMKAGCAFVPLDPEFPRDRLTMIVEDASIQLIFSDEQYRSLFEGVDSSTTSILDIDHESIVSTKTDDLHVELEADSLAYVMYTSGSTGKPKGVQIEHRALLTYCLADIDVYRLNADDRTLQFSTLNFDIAIEEIFPPLLVGSTVVVRPRERANASNELSYLIESYQVTALHIATAYWHEWVDLLAASGTKVPASLRLVIATGEKVSVEHFRRWKRLCDQDVLWCNAYGPTETTVTCTVFIPADDWDDEQMPIGKPLLGYSAYILDEDNQPVDIGVTGHLFIGGDALARGYLNRPELNEKAFIEWSWAGETLRLYQTGDLARWSSTGNIDFSGRVDHQMKIGSYRIEPGEIEAVLAQSDLVRESLVICEEIEGQKALVAYVVTGDAATEPFALAQFLRERLPAYMVPTRYVVLDSFPKTINGKIDRRALPAPATGLVARESKFESATNELEEQLCRIWSDVLRIENVGRHDDFFLLGGSSLLVTRVLAKLASKLNRSIPVRDFFANPTIASLSRHLARFDTKTIVGSETSSSIFESSRELRAKLPRIEADFIDCDQRRIATFYYSPIASNRFATARGILLCNAIGHEGVRAHRNLQQLAVGIAQLGYHVLRFDFSGHGNSSEIAPDHRLVDWQFEIESALTNLSERMAKTSQVASLSLLGVRLGATLASQIRHSGLENLILWDPVTSGSKYLRAIEDIHRHELNSLTRFLKIRRSAPSEILGFNYPPRLHESLSDLRWSNHTSGDVMQRWIVTSRSDPSEVQSIAIDNGWNLIETDDEIFWEEQRFIQSAFASGKFNREILSILQSGT